MPKNIQLYDENMINQLKKPIRDCRVISVFLLLILIIICFTIIPLGSIPAVITEEPIWDVTITVKVSSGATDTVVFGEATDATTGSPPDAFDVPKAPVGIEPYIRSWFDDDLSAPYHRLMKDIRRYPDTQQVWNLSIVWVPTDYVSSTTGTLSWTSLSSSGYDTVDLVDESGDVLVDMLVENSFTTTFLALRSQKFYITCNTTEQSTEPPTPPEDQPSTGENTTPPPNQIPVANASLSDIYGAPRDILVFNGSQSYDPDGMITLWEWDFGDGGIGSGEVVEYSYETVGIYDVTLTVWDDADATDTDEYLVFIAIKNNPPEITKFSGPLTGRINVSYEFILAGTDLDNETMYFSVDWGDGELNNTSEPVLSDASVIVVHQWVTAGYYSIEVYARDENQAISDQVSRTILINGKFAGNFGYFLDRDNDLLYEVFFSNETGLLTQVMESEEGMLLDIDGDAIYEYVYTEGGGIQVYESENDQVIPGFSFVVVVISVFFVSFLSWRFRKKIE